MRQNNEVPEVVGDLMTVDLIAVQPDDRVQRARDLLLSLGINALPVMDGNDVLGIVTSTDLIDDWPEEEFISTIMTAVPTSISVEASVAEAAETMVSNRVHHLMVDDDHEVVGILSSFDLLAALAVPSNPSV